MTPTAVSAAPHDTALLPLPTAAEVVAVQAVQDYPAVSVLCATRPAAQMSRSCVARLNGLVGQAVQRLGNEDDQSMTTTLVARLTRLASDAADRPTDAAVALYVSAEHESAWSLPVNVTVAAGAGATTNTANTRARIEEAFRTLMSCIS